MQLDRDGARRYSRHVRDAELAALAPFFSIPNNRPGRRLGRDPALRAKLAPFDALARSLLGDETRPVRAVLFNKTPGSNWALGWHQDRAIAVRERIETPNFADWTIKSGIHHVVPPFEILARMLTFRIHLDPVAPDNAPLLIAPGSHLLGRVAEPDIPTVVTSLGTHACLADRGDTWVYATPILHASETAAKPASRKVLQLYYSAEDLPGSLDWLGV